MAGFIVPWFTTGVGSRLQGLGLVNAHRKLEDICHVYFSYIRVFLLLHALFIIKHRSFLILLSTFEVSVTPVKLSSWLLENRYTYLFFIYVLNLTRHNTISVSPYLPKHLFECANICQTLQRQVYERMQVTIANSEDYQKSGNRDYPPYARKTILVCISDGWVHINLFCFLRLVKE